ncbi:hypothetical protein SVIOM74S_00047 [Streptomyces violarus]
MSTDLAATLDLDAVQDRIETVLADFLRRSPAGIPSQKGGGGELTHALADFVLAPGKRIRPLLCVLGWHAAGGGDGEESLWRMAASLEVFHAFALIHDDIIDNSPTRRGRPSTHRAFAARHRARPDADAFGVHAAILLGDLALVCSDALMNSAGLSKRQRRTVLPLVDAMRGEVLLGQHLDLLATGRPTGDVDEAMAITRLKTAKYTVERPLHLGAALAGADRDLLALCSAYALPLGEAFQLRDDLLGVFGDPALTGKPVLEDLRSAWKRAYAMYTGFDSIGPGRVGFMLNLRGPQVVVESACASGLVAVHSACQSLRTGESDVALAGAAMLALGSQGVIAPALWGVFSPTGRCHAFDAAADGYVRGEGCGVVVLKRLEDAVRAGDRVLAVLRGTAVNQNGRGTRLSAPSEPAQIDLYRLALERAGVDAGDVGMVEAHGPGTAVGDPIEFAAVATVYGKGRDRCALGSVKTNIGHTEPVSGVAGLLKAIASLRHGMVPASLHFRDWNPQIDPSGTRLFVPTDTVEWPVRNGTRLAAVSSFGISGTNVHVVLEQPPASSPVRRDVRPLPSGESGPPRADEALRVFPLSAGTPVALRSAAGRLAQWLRGEGARVPLGDVAHTLAVRRSPARERAAVVAADRSELVARLEELAAGTPPTAGVATGSAVPDAGQRVVWVFSGHGSQWAGMCRQLLDHDPEFTRVIDELEPLVAEESGFSLRQTLCRPEVVTGFDRVQPVIFAIQLGLAAMWRSHGVEPAAVIGHSMGEVAAAVAAGALSVRDGVRVICRRSRLILRTAGQGLMASVALSRAEVERLLAEQDVRGVGVAVVASPENTVIGGDADHIRQLAEEWDARGVGIRVIEVDVASHTAHMDPVLPDLADALADITGGSSVTAFYSTVADDPREHPAFDAAYWSDNLRRVVRFADAVQAAAEDGHRLFLEIGPHPVLAQPVQATLAAHGHSDTAVVPSLLRDTDDALAFHTHVAALHCAGHPLDWADRYGDGALADVPPTTWERTRYVVAPSP